MQRRINKEKGEGQEEQSGGKEVFITRQQVVCIHVVNAHNKPNKDTFITLFGEEEMRLLKLI